MVRFRKKLSWWVLGILAVVTVFIWYAVIREDRAGLLTVAFLDVGQGDAVFIESPFGNQALIDGGPPTGAVLRALGRVMPFYDRTIDMVVATHPDQDHFAGLIDVLRRYRVSLIGENGARNDTATYAAYEKAIMDERADKETVEFLIRRGGRIELGGGAYLEVLFPDRDMSAAESNTGSIVMKLVYGETAFLLTGDSPVAIENYLVSLAGAPLAVDVLKVGHHGSNTSTGEALLAAASPAYAVVSAGKDNSYGHPHEEVLGRLKQFEIETLGTHELGTIVFVSDGTAVRRKK